MSESTRVDAAITMIESVFDTWVSALQATFMLAKAEYVNRMLMVPVSRYDSRGIDPFSEMWGAVQTLHRLLPPEVNELGVVDPLSLKAEAKDEAIKELETMLSEKPLGQLLRERRKPHG